MTLETIKSTAHKYLPGAEVILFGSRALSKEKTDSDYDVLIIVEKNLIPKEKLPLRTKIRKDLLMLGIRSDVLIQSKNEVDKKKNLPGHIIRRILEEGTVL